jgi:hypothetical protein
MTTPMMGKQQMLSACHGEAVEVVAVVSERLPNRKNARG